MTATATSVPPEGDEERSVVDVMLDQVVERFHKNGGEVNVSKECQRIVTWLQRRDPDALIGWFEEHMLQLLGQRLQVRLACARRKERRSVFAPRDQVSGSESTVEPESVFQRGHHCANGNWKPVGDMLRPDWQHVSSDRLARIQLPAWDLMLAKRMIAKLPDDVTRTSAVLSEDEFQREDDLAKAQADRWLKKVAI